LHSAALSRQVLVLGPRRISEVNVQNKLLSLWGRHSALRQK